MQLLDWWTVCARTITCRRHSRSCTGYRSSTNCASWCTKWWLAMRSPTWLVCWLQSPMSHRGLLFELSPTRIMSSLGPIWNSVRGHSLSLLLKHGISCQQNSSWCVPRQISSAAWKHSSSGLPTVTSSSDRTNLDNVMRRCSSCRRRTKSTVDLIWFWTITYC